MVLPIVTYPDTRLKQQSKEVAIFDKSLHILLDNMYETMLQSSGIGLAAVQVGEPIRALLINLPNDEGEQLKEELLETINPIITKREGTIYHEEGCLSVPGIYEEIKRDEKITIEFQNRFGDREVFQAEGMLSIALQHEIDHLNGRLFIDNFSFLKRKKFEKEWKKHSKVKNRA